MFRIRSLVMALVCMGALALFGCQAKTTTTADNATMTKPASGHTVAEEAHLTNFDDLDFNVFSNQKWDELKKSHADNIMVYWPDGHTTTGLPQHIEDLKALFVWMPNLSIKEHPIRIADGDWTACTGVMTGTFSAPMPLPGGGSIPPTNKSINITMCTVGHWNGDTMDEEHLFWDQKTFMDQLGLGGGK
jgi:hypothetical protein